MVGLIPPPCSKYQIICSLSLSPELYHIIQEKINDIEQLAFRTANFSMLIAHYPFDNTLKDTGSNGLHLATVGGASSDHIRTYTLKEKATGSPMVVYWLAVPMQTDFTAGKVQITLPGKPIDNPVLVDLLDGRVYAVNPIEHECRMVFEGLPVGESPVVLCSRRLLEVIPGGEQ